MQLVTTDPVPIELVLQHFGVTRAALLGRGGEACVFALDAERVLRVPHLLGGEAHARVRAALLAELSASSCLLPFAIPRILESRVVAGVAVSIEARYPGVPLNQHLSGLCEAERGAIVPRYLDALDALAALAMTRVWYGDLLDPEPLRASRQRDYLEQRAGRSLAAGGAAYGDVDAAALAAAVPEPMTGGFVNLDAHPANVLVHAGTITALIDFGSAALYADVRLTALCGAAYLEHSDPQAVQSWLQARGRQAMYPAVRRWIAAYWAFAHDDRELAAWCQGILRAP